MKISIAGSGKIVGEVMQMLHDEFCGRIEVTGIFAREQSRQKAETLCQQTGHPHTVVYTDYDQMLQHCEADIVYIANANHVHYSYALKAMQAGHHVLVEKPVAIDRAQTDALYDCALQHCVFCIPAYSLLYMPLYQRLYEVLPQLGRIRMVNCCYAQYSSRYDRYLKGDVAPAFDPRQAGGALMDLNVYNLCFTIGLFGPPCFSRIVDNKGYNGVDTSGCLILQYPGFYATLNAAKDCDGHNFGSIQGENGFIEVQGSVSVMESVRICIRGHEPVTWTAPAHRHRLSYELEEVLHLLEDRDQCHINIPLVSRVAQEIAICIDHAKVN